MVEGIQIRKSSIRVNLQGRFWTVKLKPTKTNIAQVSRDRERIKSRVELGENLDDILEELKGKKRSRSLGYYAQHFFDIVAPEKVADSTLMGYVSAYNAHWLPFDEDRIDAIKITELQRHLSEKKLTKKTRRNALSVLRLIYACACPEVFTSNPLDQWTIPKSKNDETPEADPYTAQERDQLLEWLQNNSPIAWRYFTHGFGSGMRTGELLGAEWKDYNRPFFNVHQEMVRREIKSHVKTKPREVMFPMFVNKMLEDNPTRFKKGLIHLSPEGHMFRDGDWLMEWWRKAHEATGVRRRLKPYPWRSTYITQLLIAGFDIHDVARWSGNSPTMIQNHYYKYIPNEKRDKLLADKLDEALI